MSEETTGDLSGLFEGNCGAPPPGGARGYALDDWRRRSLPPARGLNHCGQRVITPSDRSGPPPAFNPPCNNISVDFAPAPGTGRQIRRRRASAFAPARNQSRPGASSQLVITKPAARWHGRR